MAIAGHHCCRPWINNERNRRVGNGNCSASFAAADHIECCVHVIGPMSAFMPTPGLDNDHLLGGEGGGFIVGDGNCLAIFAATDD